MRQRIEVAPHASPPEVLPSDIQKFRTKRLDDHDQRKARWFASSVITSRSECFESRGSKLILTRTYTHRLLRKVDFTTYKSDNSHREAAILRRYCISKPVDYSKYNRICGSLRQLAHQLSNLEPTDPVRIKQEKLLLEKLYDMGILSQGTKLSEVERKVGVSKFARRRLGVVMTRLGMAETVQGAVKFIEQGHVRVGTDVVTDPAFCVSRSLEDFVTWVDSSKVKRNILKYREKLDDFDLL